jgi:uncharacterized metal-binding protein
MKTMEKEKCTCNSKNVIVYSCSGASNLGQACNEVALRMAEGDEARMGCLAGVGGHVPNMVMSAQNADTVIVLDGCGTGCAKKMMDHVSAVSTIHVVATDLGLTKVIGQRCKENEVHAIIANARLKRNQTIVPI